MSGEDDAARPPPAFYRTGKVYKALPEDVYNLAVETSTSLYAQHVEVAKDIAQRAVRDGMVDVEEIDRRLIRPLSNTMDCKLWASRAERKVLLESLITIALVSRRETVVTRSCFHLISSLLKRRLILRKSDHLVDFTLDPRPIMSLVEDLWFTPSRKQYLPSPKTDAWVGRALERISNYFAYGEEGQEATVEGAAKFIWDTYRPQLCPHSLSVRRMLRNLCVLLSFLPTCGVTQEMLDDVITHLWPMRSIIHWGNEILMFVRRVVEAEVLGGVFGKPQCTVLPHLKTIFSHVTQTIKIGPDYKYDVELLGRGNSGKELFVDLAGCTVASLLRLQWDHDPDSAMKVLSQLLRAIDTFLGRCHDKADQFVVGLSKALQSMVRDEKKWIQRDNTEQRSLVPRSAPTTTTSFLDGVSESTRSFCEAAVETILPYSLNLLMNNKTSVARAGITSCAILTPCSPSTSLSRCLHKVVERVKLTAAVQGSTAGYSPDFLEALVPVITFYGSEELLLWSMECIQEGISPEYSKGINQLVRCIIFICSSTPLTSPQLLKWGVEVFNRMLRLVESIEKVTHLAICMHFLLGALPVEGQDAVCSAVEAVVRSRIHSHTAKKTPYLQSVSTIVGCCCRRCPAWGVRIADYLCCRIRGDDVSEAGMEWSAYILSHSMHNLGYRTVELVPKCQQVIEHLFFASKHTPDWRLKAGGSVLKNVLRGLTQSYLLEYIPCPLKDSEDASRRSHFFEPAAVQGTWYNPGVREVRSATALVEAVVGRSKDEVDEKGRRTESAVVAVLYGIKGFALVLREGLMSPNDLCGKVLHHPIHQEALQSMQMTIEDVVGLLLSTSPHRAEGCTEKVGCLAIRSLQTLLLDRRSKEESHHTIEFLGAMQHGISPWTPQPRSYILLNSSYRKTLLHSKLLELRNRTPLESKLLIHATRFATNSITRVRTRAALVINTFLQKHLIPLDTINEIVDHAVDLVAVAAGKAQLKPEEEDAVLGGVSLLTRSETIALLWRRWKAFSRFANIMMHTGLLEKKQIKDKVDPLLNTTVVRCLRSQGAIPATVKAEEVRASLEDLMVYCGKDDGTASRYAAVLLSEICRLAPDSSFIPFEVIHRLVLLQSHSLLSIRKYSRSALSQVLQSFKPRIPRTVVNGEPSCTFPSLCHKIKLYDYSSPPPPVSTVRSVRWDGTKQCPGASELLHVLTPDYLETILTLDEQDDDIQEALREERSNFNWYGAQAWKGLFQILRGDILDVVEKTPCLVGPLTQHSKAQAEVIAGLMRALRHWRNPSDRNLLMRSWDYILSRMRGVFKENKVRVVKDMQEALKAGCVDHENVEPLGELLLGQLPAATGLLTQSNTLIIISHYLQQLRCTRRNFEWVQELLRVMQRSNLHIEYDAIRTKLSSLNITLLHFFYRLPAHPSPVLSSFLSAVLPKNSPLTDKVLLSTVGSLPVAVVLFFDTVLESLVHAAEVRQVHDDDGELLRSLCIALSSLMTAYFTTPQLLKFVDALLGISEDALVRVRGLRLTQAIVQMLAMSCFDTLTTDEVHSKVRSVLAIILRSHQLNASEAVTCVTALSRVSEDQHNAQLLDLFDSWRSSKRTVDRRAAAAGYGGVILAHTYSATVDTLTALASLIQLLSDPVSDVRNCAAEAVVTWRQSVKEHTVVWRKIEPLLRQENLLHMVLSAQKMSSAGFS